MKNRRNAFTLVEILVVIGIILILVGIAVVGFNQLDRVVTAKATKTTLQNAQGMVDEFAAINGTGLLEEYWIAPPSPAPANYPPRPVYIDSSTTTSVSVAAPYDSTASSGDMTLPSNRFTSAAVFSTQQAMSQLQRIPANKQSMGQMPTKQLLAAAPATPTGPTAITVDAALHPTPSMLTDGWRVPIILVPAGGLTGVTLNGVAQGPIKSPDGRPFWASAGPDGDFTKGDDNVYSFQN